VFEIEIENYTKPVFLKYAMNMVKIILVVVQFPINEFREDDRIFALYWDEFGNKTEIEEVDERSGEILMGLEHTLVNPFKNGTIKNEEILLASGSTGNSEKEISTVDSIRQYLKDVFSLLEMIENI
jgi:hypothetical protein